MEVEIVKPEQASSNLYHYLIGSLKWQVHVLQNTIRHTLHLISQCHEPHPSIVGLAEGLAKMQGILVQLETNTIDKAASRIKPSV